jgi:radical SAM superfamily enzyme YgiQ (UPF0313 family)
MLKAALDLAGVLRNSAPDAKIVLGGPLAAAMPEQAVGQGRFDGALVGDGELVISSIFDASLRGDVEELAAVPGMVTRRDGAIVRTEAAPPLNRLDDLPHPAMDLLLKRSILLSFPVLRAGDGLATAMMTARGCPYSCSFCSRFPYKSLYRTHSVGYLIDYISRLQHEHGITAIRFLDEVFTLDRDRALGLCEAIARHLPHLTWHCSTRIDLIDGELLAAMHSAGCRAVTFGLESGDHADLERMGKRVQTDARRVVEMCRRYGLDVLGQFIVGFPWDTPESIRERGRFARSLPLAAVNYWPLAPFPGTPIFDEAVKRHGEFDPAYIMRVGASDRGPMLAPVYSPPGMTRRQMAALVAELQLGFYIRPGVFAPLAYRMAAREAFLAVKRLL